MRFYVYDQASNLTALITKANNAKLEQNLGQYDALAVEFPISEANMELLKDAYYLGIPVYGQYELFRVQNTVLTSLAIQVTGLEAASDDLHTQGYVEAISDDNCYLSSALDKVFKGSMWEYELLAPDSKKTLVFNTGSRKDLLEQIRSNWGIETEFRYEMSGSKIKRRVCYVKSKIGGVFPTRLVRGQNVLSWQYTSDYSQIYTACLALGSKMSETLQQPIPGSTETTETTREWTVDLTQAEWSKAAGNPIDKPAGQNYVELPDLTAKFGWQDENGTRHPRMAVKTFSDDKDPQTLLTDAYLWLIDQASPKVAVTASVSQVGEIKLGDDCTLIDYSQPKITIRERAIKISRDLLNDHNTVVQIGQYTIKTTAQRIQEAKKELKQSAKDAIKDARIKAAKDTALKIKPIKLKQAAHENALKLHENKLKDHEGRIKGLKDLGDKLNKGFNDNTAKLASQGDKLKSLQDKLNGTGAGAGIMTDTTGRFAMHFDQNTPNKVLTADFNYDSGAKLGFNGSQFTMTDDTGGTVASLDHTGLLTAAEISAGTVKSPQIDGGGKGSLIAHYEEIGQTKSPIGKVYAGEFDPVAVLPDGSVQDDSDNSASFQADHLELDKNVGTYNKQAFLTSDSLTLSYPLADETTGSYGNQKIVLELNNDAVPSVPQLLISQGKNKAVLTPTGLYFNDKNIIEMTGDKTTLPDNLLTSDTLGGALNSLSSAMINGSKILTEQNLSDMFDDAEQKGAGSYNVLVESLLNLVISHDFMDFICRELDAREYAKISDITRN